MKKLLNILILFCLFTIGLQAQIIIESTRSQVTSPDGKYVFDTYQKEFPKGEKQLYYTLSYNNKTVIEESELGVLIENQLFESALAIPNDTFKIWGENLTLTGKTVNNVNTVWKPVYGEHATIRDHYNELTLKFFKSGENTGEHEGGYDKRRYYMMNFIIRAYNDGIAFRYHFPEATNGLFLHITGEQTQFTLPEGTMAYYERWAQGPYSLLPLKDWTDECERPLTMKLQNGLTVALGEAEMIDYARMKFRLNDKKANTLQASLYSSVDVITPYSTPWRVIMAAEKATDLIANNDIILNLNPENKIKDTSWIKPGKVMRVAKLTQEDAKKCVDFAAERGLQYIHIDAGWYGPEMSMSSDATTVAENKDFDIPALAAYASSKGIGLMVYVNQRALVQQLDEILPLYKKWGIKGIKFGFVQIGNQHWSTWLHDAVRKCAEYEMLVDIHDEYRPTGFSRTYPNLMTQEGIRGNEEMPDATHNTILPFTRFLAGAGDYTICYYNNRIKTTHAHQLAMAAVYYSPLQFLYWYDQPSAYTGEPEIEFFDKVKTLWDDTKAIDGDIGEFVTIARRSGEDWFLGTIGNNEARSIVTPLSFLDEGQKYIANIYTDDDKIETKTKVKVTRLIVDNTSSLQFRLKASGGCAIHFTPATKEDVKKNKAYKKNQIL
ncbi:glycoside hydrolase family 97 protein [Dysgonomonas macrotermitis]|uniref:Alpha-glucosidase n=1 Tax=Dysgonomonas macrotermitis TaxID=1346286 RepID=A0A1M5JK37_9BACT|nr:glycoside hydrolase family 97 protein [Dysgonomonas macrotermitis]SHG40956.1 alpha-glucosidase [Dysgonomonas macrotermitis]